MDEEGFILVLAAIVLAVALVVVVIIGLARFWEQDLDTIRLGLGGAFVVASGGIVYGIWRGSQAD